MHACFFNAIFIVTTVKLEASKPCLTWSVQDNSITILFRNNSVSLPVSFYDPIGQEQAKCCSNNNSIACETSHPFGRIEYKRTAIIFTIARITEHFKYGNWSCRHGQNTIHVLVSLLEGTVYETNLELTGSLTENDNIITLNCFTCWNILTDSVEFLYNDETVVNVRYKNGQCFYTNGECKPRYCACSKNNYEWKTNLQNYIKSIQFSCMARFRDDYKKMEFFKYTTVVFNGTAFVSGGTITEINEPFINNDNWKTKNNDTGVIGTVHDAKWYVIVPSVLVLVGLTTCTILVIKISKRKEYSSGKKDISVIDEQNPFLAPKIGVPTSSDDFHYQDSSTVLSKKCYACRSYRIHATCTDCEQIFCEICCGNHQSYYQDHRVCQLTYISKSKMQCKACHENAGTEVCSHCIKVFCGTCAGHHYHPMIKITINPESMHSFINTKSAHDNKKEFKDRITMHTGDTPDDINGKAFLSDNCDKNPQKFDEYKLIGEPRGLNICLETKSMWCRS